jgi:hypothetical protein
LKMKKDAQRQRIEEITMHYESVVHVLRSCLSRRTEGFTLQLMQHRETKMLLCFSKWRMATRRTSKIHLHDQLEAVQNAVAITPHRLAEPTAAVVQTTKTKPELGAVFDIKLKMAGLREAFVGIMGKRQRCSRLVSILRFWRGRFLELKSASQTVGSARKLSVVGKDSLSDNSSKKGSKKDGIWSIF